MKNLKLYTFFWVIPRSLNFICRRFGTLCLFQLHGMKIEQTVCSETSAYKIQTSRNYPEKRYNDGIFTSTGKLPQRYGSHYTEIALFAKIYQYTKII